MLSRIRGTWLCVLAFVLATAVAPAAPPKDKEEAPRVPAKQDRQPKGLAGVGLTPEQVNAAIDKGAAYLWNYLDKQLRDERSVIGSRREQLLYALALVHANAHKKYPEFDAALRAGLAKMSVHNDVYDDGLICMLVESYGDATFLAKLHNSAQYLVDAQGKNGTWTYSCNAAKKLSQAEPPPLRTLQVSGGTPLDGSAKGKEINRRIPWEEGEDGDRSCTQYGLLGLNSAVRAGVVVSQEVWQRDLKSHREQQSDDGGWGYEGRGGSKGAMACAGICAVAIDRYQLGEKEPAVDEAVERGLAWMDANFSVTKYPKGNDDWLYYYLYSLERVGRILDTEFIGEHEWYPLGAKSLLALQKADGSWKGHSEDEPIATSFALLFLTRATPSLLAQPKRNGDGILKTSSIAHASRYYFILDGSGSMLEEMGGKTKFDIARDAVLSLIKQLPPEAEVAVRVYGHRKSAIDQGADEDSELLLPMAKLDQKKAQAALLRLRPRGKTPLALSLREAAKDLAKEGESPEEPVTVVLLTDGGEDTVPRQDPVRAADQLRKLKGITLHVVGFDVAGRDEWMQQLQAIAAKANGKFWPAPKADTLMRQLRCAILAMPDEYQLLDMAGKSLGTGIFGENKTLHEGHYRLRTIYGEKQFDADFWINTEATTAVVFDAKQAEKDPTSRPAETVVDPIKQPPATEQTAPAGEKKFCANCGAPLKAGAKFCTQCGAKTGQ